jgi:general L-amino acid transport system substrate-binding protein
MELEEKRMSRKLYSLFALLLIASVVLSACGSSASAPPASSDDSSSAPAEDTSSSESSADSGDTAAEEEAAPAQAGSGEILQRVLDRGTLVCGGRTDLVGFGYLDEDGNNIGFDIDLCRAVAAAVLGDANAIEVVPLTAADRGPALQTAEVDMLSRNVTWTSKRDAEWGNFTIVMFYDGQGFMVRNDSGITEPADMDGATVCVTSGTTTESNLATYFADNGWSYEAVIAEESAVVYSNYDEGRCDVTTSDKSQLAAVRTGLTDPTAHTILDVTISKEPLTPAVPSGDDVWFDIVKSVMYGLINAELYGVTQDNVGSMASSENGNIRTLVGAGDDWGNGQLGLDVDALARAIAAVGNYGEIYNRYMGPDGIAFTLPRGLNNHWTNGGLIYAPPIK